MNTTLRFLAVSILAGTVGVPAHGQVSVVTYRNDVARTGQNLSETLLTPANVSPANFGKLFTRDVQGYVVGQPLYLPNVTIPGAGTHNVVYVATMNDRVYAFDADSNQGANAAPLWMTDFTNPGAGITSVPMANQSCGESTAFTEIGIVGTPVLDPTTGTLFVVAKTLENGVYVHRLHALDVASGQEKLAGPVAITASVTNSVGAAVQFDAKKQMSRPGLLLSQGVLYIAFGSLGCNGGGVHGWVMAYDSSTLEQLGVFNTTPDAGGGAGIWQAGGGIAADASGNLYFQTADGVFDANLGTADFGDSLLKLTPGNGLVLSDYFTPYNQATLQSTNGDLGSGGVLVLPDQPGSRPHLLVGGGKGGTIYLINRDNMGRYCDGCSSDAQIVQSIPGAGSMESTPAYWNNKVYVASGYGVSAYSLAGGLLSKVSQSAKAGGLSSPMISANGTNNAILWIMNYNILNAYDAANLAKKLYASNMAGTRDSVGATAHFAIPMIANGRVYVGTTSQLVVFGLYPGMTGVAGNNQSGTVQTVLPVPLQVQAVEPYSGTVYRGVTVTFSDGGKGGTFSNPTATTDSSGNASTTYTLPPRARPVTVTATATGLAPATFTETAVAGPAKRLGARSGNNQTAPVSSPLPAPLVVVVLDAYGNGVGGVEVSFADGAAGGSFSATTAITDDFGKASVIYVTPATAGSVTITASSAGLNSVRFLETVTSP
jgi:hypothetical protein